MFARNKSQQKRPVRNTRKSSRSGGSLGAWINSINWVHFRIRFIAGVFFLLLCVLWARAGYLQLIDGSRLASMAKRQHVTAELITGQRGSIFDRNGHVLARSVEVRSVYAHPYRVLDVDSAARQLAKIIGKPERKIRSLLTRKKRFVWIERKLDDYTASQIRKANIKGVGLTREYERVYPFRYMAGQLLGFVGMDDKGLEGLERSFDDVLAGTSTRLVVERDAAGRRFYLSDTPEEAIRGHDVHLTIDTQIQFFAEEALAATVTKQNARWGGALVIDVASGDILAWAQYPFFNPNAYNEYRPADWRNRLSSDALEPGSTLKPFLVGAALQENVVTPDTIFFCENGRWSTRGVSIRDTKSSDWLPVHKIIRFSSNIGCAKIGLELGVNRYHDYLTKLGFGTRIGLPVSESRGIVRSPGQWNEVDLMAASFGQSLAATATQMGEAYLALANDGVRKPLRIIKASVDSAALQECDYIHEGLPTRIFDAKVAQQVRSMLYEVVEQGGRGSRASIPGVHVGGKTGTAQKADATGSYGKGRVASFVGLVPIEKPRYLILVVVDEPKKSPYGSVVAAPVFKDVAMRTMAYQGLLPDTSVGKNVQTHAVRSKQGAREIRRSIAMTPQAKGNTIPNVIGKPVRQAVEIFANHGVIPRLQGLGQLVVKQSPKAGEKWQHGQESILWLAE